jgi:Alkylmercury lyase
MPVDQNPATFDNRLRLLIYSQMIRRGKCPTVAEMADTLAVPTKKIRASLARLSETHAFMLQENGELWRVAPFSAIPTAFPVCVGKRSWFANCIWDALGIPAMLGKETHIGASCACCNFDMPIHVKAGKLVPAKGIIHIAVPARDWYRDVAFT